MDGIVCLSGWFNLDLTEKIEKYAEKFKEFDERIVEGVSLCYSHSPTFRKHVDSPHFGEVRGWRITWLWTPHVKQYEMLKLIGPLDLGLYSVRIDGILREADVSKFVQEARSKPVFQEYITATAEFISELIRRGEVLWVQDDANAPLEPALELCLRYSPTFKKVTSRLAEEADDGWEIVRLWVANPEKVEALRSIFPLDIAIYCVRLDSITYDINLTDFGREVEEIKAFKLFPREIVRFTFQVLAEGFRRGCSYV